MATLQTDPADSARTTQGVAYGVAAYLFWGFFPLYFKQLDHIPPLEVLAHRSVWALVTLALILAVTSGWSPFRAALRDRHLLLILGATTVLIATNWLIFLYAVTTSQVLQSSLGYFINPLVSALLGFLFLRERLDRLQVASIVIAAAGVLVMAWHHGSLPWIPMVLAVTFGLYGLLRKIASVDALTGLAVETLLLFPAAGGYLWYLDMTSRGSFLASSVHDDILLPLAGVVTAIPLLWFAAAARRLRLVTVGFMQYLTPTLHFLLAVLVFGEPFTRSELASFACIWSGLALYSWHAARSWRLRG